MITEDAFPLPQRILTSADSNDHEHLARFTTAQIDGAHRAAEVLEPLWRRARRPEDRLRALEAAHATVVGWRYELALRSSGKHVHGHSVGAERFMLAMNDLTLNWDRLNPTAKDGGDTPGAQTMRTVEAMARQQFDRCDGGDTIHHVVLLDGTPWLGTTLVRGQAAHEVAGTVTRRLNARGITDVDFGNDPVFSRVPCDASRAAFFQHALTLLSRLDDSGDLPRDHWYEALYLLLLSPKYKRGGDSVCRTFAVAVAEVALAGDVPPFTHDVDFRAFVLPQRQFLLEQGHTGRLACPPAPTANACGKTAA